MNKSKGEKVVIEGVLYRNGNDGDIYSAKSSTKSSTFEALGSETVSQTSQTVIQAAVSQAQSIGASGLVAMGSGAYFQINAVVDNTKEAIAIAEPLVHEFVETGTITPPIGSKYEGVAIPTTTSFLGVKVGEERKKQQAYDALTPEQKAAQDVIRQSTKTPDAQAEEREASSI